MKPLRALARTLGAVVLSLAVSMAQAAPQHALTLYDEAPKYPANFQHYDYVNPAAPKGGTFRQKGVGSFDSLNPFISKGVPADDIDMIYDTLARRSLDEPFTEYGLVAGRIEKAPDNSWVRFYLRPEARFHDGQPMRAEDVVFSFQTLMQSGSPLYRGYYADVADVVAEDPLRVLFKFKHSNNRELPLILGQLPVLPKHFWKAGISPRAAWTFPWAAAPTQSPRSRRGARFATSGSRTTGHVIYP